MKFYDNKRVKHDTYIESVKSTIINKINNMLDNKFPGIKESENMTFEKAMAEAGYPNAIVVDYVDCDDEDDEIEMPPVNSILKDIENKFK